MAKDTNCYIVPFAITKKYKLLKKSVTISFGEPYKVTEEINLENNKLENKVIELIRSNR